MKFFRVGAGLLPALLILVFVGGCRGGADAERELRMPSPSDIRSKAPSGTASNPAAWPGPLRSGAWLPVLARRDARGWADPRDTAFALIDLRRVSGTGHHADGVAVLDFGGGDWSLGLVARPPRTDDLEPEHVMIEYGVVVDADGDHEPDCHIGINNDAPQRGQYLGQPISEAYRVWVTNLRTGRTAEQVGPPYGYPVDFAHPGERGEGRFMRFFFLQGVPADCDRFGPAASFYAYASLTEDGEVTTWDYAPDAAWLPMRCDNACRELGNP